VGQMSGGLDGEVIGHGEIRFASQRWAVGVGRLLPNPSAWGRECEGPNNVEIVCCQSLPIEPFIRALF